MSENSINHLGKIVQDILEVLRKFMKEIMDALNVLKRLPEMITEFRQDVNAGFDNLIQAQAEMEIYIRMANLESKKSLVLAENEAISDFESQLKEDLLEIDKRYSNINDELEVECKKRIREIDAHLLDIPNKFPQDLYTTYQRELLPLFQNLLKDNSISYSHRMAALRNAAEKTSLVVNRFVTIRTEFMKQVKEFEIPDKVEKMQTYHVPLWIMEYRTGKNGKTKSTAILPGRMSVKKGMGVNTPSKLDADSSLWNLRFIQDSDATQQRIIRNFQWKSDGVQRDKVAKNFVKYFETINPNKQVMVKDAVAKAINRSKFQTIK